MKHQLVLFLVCCLSSIHAQDLLKYETFEISHTQDTSLATNLGTRITITSNSFRLVNNGSITSTYITLKVKELVDQNDMVLAGVSTNTNDGILISNGMILIEGYMGKEKLELKEDSKIEVEIPANNGNSGMSLYVMPDTSNTWNRSVTKVELDTCKSYSQEVITRTKIVSKSEYKKWRKEQEANNQSISQVPERLFWGVEIDVRNARNKQYSIQVPMDTIWRCNVTEMSYYKFSMRSMGWHNIDKLNKLRKPVTMTVTTSEKNLDLFLVLTNKNISVRASKTKQDGVYKFKNLPRNAQAKVVGYKQIDARTIKMVIQYARTNSGKLELSPFKIISLGEFRRLLK